jgi:hypothetical protein
MAVLGECISGLEPFEAALKITYAGTAAPRSKDEK